ncbi:hypothetical protein BKA70DRAFT_1468175 [Coprinopsis sp. MPI-PUGE-AT-0042]|nr:hypothetical protein BKA70DRAFT_1468175 [Coprinopsis sp. MPI-PUGE-AT-0042]
MVLHGLSVFLGTPKDAQKGRLPFIVTSCLILATSSIDAIFDMWRTFRVLFAGGLAGGAYTAAYQNDWEIYGQVIVAGDSILAIAIAIGDILMLWRCLVLWRDKKWVVVLPSLSFLGSIICQILYLLPQRTDIGVAIDALKASVASTALSVATNIMITLLILFKLVKARLNMSKALPDRKPPRLYSDVTSIIVESAAPLAVFGICSVIVTVIGLRPPEKLLERGRIHALIEAFGSLYYGFSVLSPQMIIFRVTTGRSWKNAKDSEEGFATFSQPINFARSMNTRRDSFSSASV